MVVNRPDLFTRTFWLNTSERVIRVFAYSTLTVLITAGTDIQHTDFKGGAIQVALATALCFFTCLAGKAVGDPQTPSFILARASKINP